MRLGQVVGTVVATVKNPNLVGQRLLLVQPYTYEREKNGAIFAAVDLTSASPGTWVYYVGSREAANALPDPFTPCDRTIMGIVDEVSLEREPEGPPPAGD